MTTAAIELSIFDWEVFIVQQAGKVAGEHSGDGIGFLKFHVALIHVFHHERDSHVISGYTRQLFVTPHCDKKVDYLSGGEVSFVVAG